MARITCLACSFSTRHPSVGTMRCEWAAYMPQSISWRARPFARRSRASRVRSPREPLPFSALPPGAPGSFSPGAYGETTLLR